MLDLGKLVASLFRGGHDSQNDLRSGSIQHLKGIRLDHF